MVAWIVVVPFGLLLLVRLLGIDFNPALVAVIGATPLVAVASLIPLLVAVVLRVWPAAVAAVVMTGILAVLVLPRAFGGPTEATPPGPSLRVLAANMMLGEGSAEDLVQLVEDLGPDVVSVEELTPAMARDLDRLGFDSAFPHRNLAPAAASRGSGLYSRYRLIDPREAEGPRDFPFLIASIEPSGAQVTEIGSVHTVPPTVSGWQEDLDSLPPAPTGVPSLLLGDFNATIDHAPFRAVLDRGWSDAATTLGEGLTPTWPADRPRIPALFAIDHVLVGDRVGARSFSTHEIEGTDHLVVFAELQLPGA